MRIHVGQEMNEILIFFLWFMNKIERMSYFGHCKKFDYSAKKITERFLQVIHLPARECLNLSFYFDFLKTGW